MSKANEAFVAQKEGDFIKYLALTKEAFAKEKEAAWKLFQKFEAEPTRSILFRSAAQLAFNCGQMRESEQLISAALVGNPPAEIIYELRELYKEILNSLESVA
ncbi:MAG: hypothetical protein AAGJ18_06430 [Bacteroidota bacterium]